MVSVPLRGDVDVLGATMSVTAALPVVLGPAPEITVTQGTLLIDVHTHPVGMVTEMTLVPPSASSASAVEDRLAVQGAPACVTLRSSPAMAIVPLRDVPAGLAATRYETDPLPEPDPPVSTVIQDALGTAVHVHPPGKVTFVLKSAPAATTLCAVGLSVASQVAPACVMTNGWPATVIVAERELLFGLAATV
jgi:hypothetical protein